MGYLTITIMFIFRDPSDTHWKDASLHIVVISESRTPTVHSEDIKQQTVTAQSVIFSTNTVPRVI